MKFSQLLEWITVFLVVGGTDWIWVKYIQACADRRTLAASSYSAFVWGMGAAIVVGYTKDHSLLIPGVVGAFVGTYLGSRYGQK